MAMTTGNALATYVCVILTVVRVTLQAGPTKPVLTIPAGSALVVVLETAAKKEELATGITCTDADAEDEPRIFMSTISPSEPCGKCFAIWPDATASTYSLWFNPGEGDPLEISTAPSYQVQVTCTDDINTATSVIDVIILGNSPPTFTKPATLFHADFIRGTENQQAGAEIYDADAEDINGDAIFYTMQAVPDNDMFEIGYTDGIIRAKKDLRLMCEETVDFYVTASDVHNDPLPPRTIQMEFRGGNVKPEISSKGRQVEMDEDTSENKDRLVLAMNVDDSTVYKDLKWNMWAEPERGLEYYYLDTKTAKPRIRTRTTLNYEYEPLRSVTLYFNVTDGFCRSDTYSVHVDVVNVNEEPVLEPQQDIERFVPEGLMEVIPGWKAIDPDEDEKLEWEMNQKNFYIDSVSGIVYSVGEFDVDPNTERVVKTMDVTVVDKEGEKDTRTLKLIIYDINDNAPEFPQRLYRYSADECTPPGSALGRLNAVDKDSKYQGNSNLYYSGGGVNVTVINTGQIILNTACKAGQTETFSVQVSDQGTYPGPLSGTPTTIIFKCVVCPPTVPPVTEDPNPDPCEGVNAGVGQCKNFSLADIPHADYPNSIDPLEDNVGWIVPACILALILLALIIYMLWRYCCRKWLAKRAIIKKSPYPRRVRPRPKQEKKPPPREKEPAQPRPTPPVLPPDNEPELYPFWKETFGDRDQRHMPQRDTRPLNVEQDQKVEQKENQEAEAEKAQRRLERQKVVDQYNQEMAEYHQKLHGNGQPAQPPKKKRCAIL